MKFVTLSQSTHTSVEAAKALNCEVSQIIKTLLLESKDYYFILIMCGDDRINYEAVKIALNLSKRPSFASPEKVIELTGAPVGGVKPIFETDLPVLLDSRVLEFDKVYGGGGDSNTIVEITPDEIIQEMEPKVGGYRSL
jgi:prolyl-tRNA editing enzyme YbaK/EbsC (Cys-tRNA(Pro) deacylase)